MIGKAKSRGDISVYEIAYYKMRYFYAMLLLNNTPILATGGMYRAVRTSSLIPENVASPLHRYITNDVSLISGKIVPYTLQRILCTEA